MDFNDVFILECFKHKEDKQFLSMFTIPSLRDLNMSIRYQVLKKSDYMVPDPNNNENTILSVKGEDFLNELRLPDAIKSGNVPTQIVITSSKTPDECFEEWWKAYPTSPAWVSDDGNTKFSGSRVLKNLTKPKAKKRYLELLNQKLKHEELLGSLKFEIKLKKIDSIKKNVNQLEYFKGMESYLNQERYLIYIDSYKENPGYVKGEGEKVKSKSKNVTDI